MNIIKKLTLSFGLLVFMVPVCAHTKTLNQAYSFLQQEILNAKQHHIKQPVEYVFNKYTHAFLTLGEKYQIIAPKDEDNGDNNKVASTIHLSRLKGPHNIPIQTWKNFLKFANKPTLPDAGNGDINVYFTFIGREIYLLMDIQSIGTGAGKFTYIYAPDAKGGFVQMANNEFFLEQKGSDNELFSIRLDGQNYLVYRDEDTYTIFDKNALLQSFNSKKIKSFKFKYDYRYKVTGLTKENDDQVEHGNKDVSQKDAQQLQTIINDFLSHDYIHNKHISSDCDKDIQITKDNVWFGRTSEDISFKSHNKCYYGRILCYKTSDDQCFLNISTTIDGQNGIMTFDVQQQRQLIDIAVIHQPID